MARSKTKTRMFQLLRMIDFGGGNEEVLREAWACWEALSADIRKAMIARDGADGRRARLWAAAWQGAEKPGGGA